MNDQLSLDELKKLLRPNITQVSSIKEAVELAQTLKADGVYDYFRGQVNSEWLVTSSAERIGKDAQGQIRTHFGRFAAWAKLRPEMAIYNNNQDALIAIAQHYGMQTFFIDFTSDPLVAAFFASHTETEPPPNQQAAIICVNSKDFSQHWKDMAFIVKKYGPKLPEFITIDVQNLWRLQAQKGVFLWNPIINIEMQYNFERIVFPYTTNDPILPTHEQIFPLNQSKLEQDLAGFFMNEMMREGSTFIQNNIKGIKIFHMEADAHTHEVAGWSPLPIVPSDDWNGLENWTCPIVELSSDVLTGSRIPYDHSLPIQAIEKIIAIFNEGYISENRNRGLFFEESGISTAESRGFLTCLRRLWNGMRRLPFTPDEIEAAIKETSRLYILRLSDPDKYGPYVSQVEAYGPDTVNIEISQNKDGKGDYSRAFVSPRSLLNALNPAFSKAYCAAKNIEQLDTTHMERSLLIGARPRDRYTFSGLRSLFVNEIIPTQLVWRGYQDGEEGLKVAIYFSPPELQILGLP